MNDRSHQVGRMISSVLSETLVQSRAKRFTSSISSKMSALSVSLSRVRCWFHWSRARPIDMKQLRCCFSRWTEEVFRGSCFFFGKWRSVHSERCLQFWLLEVHKFSFVTFPSHGSEYIPCFLVDVLLQERYDVIIIKRGNQNQFTWHIWLSFFWWKKILIIMRS